VSTRGDDPGGWQLDAGALDDLPTALVAVDLEGRVLYLNRLAARVLSDPEAGSSGRTVTTAADIFDADALGTVAELLGHARNGGTWTGPLSVRWGGQPVQTVTAWSPQRRDGAVVGAVVALEAPPATEQHAQRMAERLGRLAAVTTDLLTAADVETVVAVVTEHMADAAGATVASLALLEGDVLRLVGLRGGVEDARERWATFPLAAPTPLGDCVRSLRPLVMTGRDEVLRQYPGLELATEGERSLVCLPLVSSGEALGGMSLSFPGVRHFERTELEFLGILADTCAQAIARIRAVAAANDRELKLTFLADASAELASSLDYEATLSAVAWLAVPRFADWCVIQLLQDGVLRPLGLAHPDAVGEERIRELQERYPPDPDAPRGAHQVARTGVSELIPDVTDEMIAAAAVDEEHRQALLDLNFRSALSVPLKVHGRVLGVITWVAGEGGRRYGTEDLAFGEDLARRAAVAIDNAELHSEVRDVALRLQQAILPERLPHAEGWEVAVRYLPAGRTDTGGDFYGLAPLADGRVAVFVGDVMGRGVQAASAMAQMRSAVRALLAVDPDPATVLAGLDKLFARFDIDQLVTLVYAVLDRDRGLLHIINAGHPAPVLVPGDGPAEMIETEDTLLLGAGGGSREIITRPLRDTDTLLLFTDGLAERRGEVIVQGYDRITRAAESLREPDLQASLDALVDAVRDPTRDDDVAALVIRAKAAFVSRRPSAERPGEVHESWLLPSDQRAAGVARRHLETALSGFPSDTLDTVRLLTSELVTNAIAHGDGLVSMTADYDGARLRVEVRDESAERPEPRDGPLLAEGGRGLHIVDALSDAWGASPSGRGKSVWFWIDIPDAAADADSGTRGA
jgi:serine phosphatase RsbU (regulator of sigma subunit)/anti-sigma regulatory factor (Ser/Thr protein kinase)